MVTVNKQLPLTVKYQLEIISGHRQPNVSITAILNKREKINFISWWISCTKYRDAEWAGCFCFFFILFFCCRYPPVWTKVPGLTLRLCHIWPNCVIQKLGKIYESHERSLSKLVSKQAYSRISRVKFQTVRFPTVWFNFISKISWYIYIYACVCMWEREREKDRDGELS